jgi:hypothetical protein
MDECDIADVEIERNLSAALRLVRDAATRPEIAPRGTCLNCEEPLDLTGRWCDVDCRSDWVKRNEAHRASRNIQVGESED